MSEGLDPALKSEACQNAQETQAEDLGTSQPKTSFVPPPGSNILTTDSSSTGENCSAYISRKWDQLGECHSADTSSIPEVTFLDSWSHPTTSTWSQVKNLLEPNSKSFVSNLGTQRKPASESIAPHSAELAYSPTDHVGLTESEDAATIDPSQEPISDTRLDSARARKNPPVARLICSCPDHLLQSKRCG